jgi:uncharacterized membrane protein YfcA
MNNKGSYTFVENSTKIKVTTSNGQDSVLFEDIASIGWTREKVISNPNLVLGVIICSLSPILGVFIGTNTSAEAGWIIFILALLIGLWMIVKTKTDFFNKISVETKGGKIISFDVLDGTASKQVDKIEDAKRQITG